MACTSKTVELKDAAEDLAYWRSLSRASETGTVFGTTKEYVRQLWIDDPSEERSFEMKPLAGQEIKVQGPDKTYTVKTDVVGRYEIRNLLPGRYVISPVSLERSLFPTNVTADLAAKGCAEVDFRRRGELLKLRRRLKPVR